VRKLQREIQYLDSEENWITTLEISGNIPVYKFLAFVSYSSVSVLFADIPCSTSTSNCRVKVHGVTQGLFTVN